MILYVANFRDGTGYSYAAINNVLAMDAAGIDVSIRNIYLNNRNLPLSQRLLELEAKPCKSPEIIIQHTLPSLMEKRGNCKNIACFYTETSNFKSTDWAAKLNLMDGIWAASDLQIQACRESGVTTPIFKAPIPCDYYKYTKSYNKMYIPELQNKFVFYFIGEFNRRKNLECLLKAFHLEFEPNEPVELLLKLNVVSGPNINPNDMVNEYIGSIKSGMKLWPKNDYYKREVVILDYMPDEAIMSLHETCDCFIMPSYGEGWNIPVFDAMAMGKTPIITRDTSMAEYITNKNGYLVPSYTEPCFGMLDAPAGLYTSRENWERISIPALMRTMREAYNNRDDPRKKQQGMEDAIKFHYDNIGELIKEKLCQV